MRALLSGYYGFGNLGDEALLEVIVAQLRARFPALELEVLSETPDATAAQFGVESTSRWNWRAIRAAVARADVVLSGGGGLLQNATSLRSVAYYAGILREAVKAKRRTMIFAQSVGPLDMFGKLIVSRLCRGVDRATVRDARSRELLHSLIAGTPVEQTADPVFLYDLPPAPLVLADEGLNPVDGPYAIVSVRKVAGFKDGAPLIARAVDRLSRQHAIRVGFLPLGGAADAEIATTVIRLCESAPMLLPECQLAKAATILQGARVVIGMRLHALILAARFGVPFAAIPYDPKVSSLCEDLEYPLDAFWVPGQPVPVAERGDALIDELIAKRDALSDHLNGRMAIIRASAARNFDVLGELLGES